LHTKINAFATILLLGADFRILCLILQLIRKANRLILKKGKANILIAWVLWFCFTAGQGIIYTHQHKINASFTTKTKNESNSTSRTTVQEKCSVCDAMHHISAVIDSYSYFSPNIVTKHIYKIYNYDFVSIALILSAGRAPPVAALC